MAAWSAGVTTDLLARALSPAAENGASRCLGIADRRSPPSCRPSSTSPPIPTAALFSPGARDSLSVSCLVSFRPPLSRVRAISASAASASDTDGPDLSPRPSLPDPTPRAVLDFPPAEGFGEELTKLLTMLPEKVRDVLQRHPAVHSLVEVVLDLGRRPVARFPVGDVFVCDDVVTAGDIEYCVSQVGEFGADNRAGIDRTLHRISAIRNRAGRIIGLTCRVGRAISGSAEMVRDLVAGGESVLLMGAPGVGKTTAIREVARILADECARRVVVVDTSNEIAGDGDIAHAAIGSARRMQVPHVELQHQVMIEAVENHMPQVVIIDEIGSELEAAAAATIAQRGVQLIATAHGRSVENLVKNPHLHTLAGGVQTVTLGDEEARRRGVQKSVMERGGPPVFQAAVEMHSRGRWSVHRNLAATVDALLSGKAPQVEVREMGQHGEVWVDGDAVSTGRGGSSSSGGIPVGGRSSNGDSGISRAGSWDEQGWQSLGSEGAVGAMGVREWDAAQPREGGGRQRERGSPARPSHAPSPSASPSSSPSASPSATPLGFASNGGSSGESSGSDTDSEGSDVDVYGDGAASDTDGDGGGGEQWGRSAMWWGGMASRSTSTGAGTTSSSASISASSASASASASASWSQGGAPAGLSAFAQATRSDNSTLLFLYQVSEEHVEQVVEVMGLAPLISLTTDIAAADAVLALRSKLKGNAWLRGVAKFRHLPIYAVKANTASQVVRALRAILNLPTLTSPPPSSSSSSSSSSSASYAASPPHSSPSATLSRNAPLPDVAIASSTPPNQLSTLQDESSKGGGSSSIGIRSSSSGSWVGGAGEDEEATRGAGGGSLEDEIDALEEARMAAESMMGSAAQAVDLLPRAPRILSLQLQLINDYPLSWQYTGSPPTRRIRILPLPASARSELAPAVICRSNSPVGAIGSVGSGVTSGGERMGWQGEQEDVEMVEGGGGVVESGGCVVENAAAAGWTVVSLPRKVG